jgi:hypothetical protein
MKRAVVLSQNADMARLAARPSERRAGFWEGSLGYPQAFLTLMMAWLVGLIFHVRIGYRVPIPFEGMAFGGLLYALGWFVAMRLWSKHPALKWLSGVPFALTTMIATGALASVGAVFPSAALQRALGTPSVFRFWPFWMTLWLLLTNLICVTSRRCWPLTCKNLCFLTSHLGLILAIFGGGLSSISLERARLIVSLGQARQKAEMQDGQTRTLPFALTLRQFDLESFPPTLALATQSAHGSETPNTTPGHRFVRAGMQEQIGNYRVEVTAFLPKAALVGETWQAVSFPTAAPAAQVRVRDRTGASVAQGWISCGSVDTAGSLLQVTPNTALVMSKPRPREYRAALTIHEPGKETARTLRVNHPISVGDYRLYLLSYDETMGAASEYVIVEAVRDRALPIVYGGMLLLLAGAAWMLWSGVGNETKEVRA